MNSLGKAKPSGIILLLEGAVLEGTGGGGRDGNTEEEEEEANADNVAALVVVPGGNNAQSGSESKPVDAGRSIV